MNKKNLKLIVSLIDSLGADNDWVHSIAVELIEDHKNRLNELSDWLDRRRSLYDGEPSITNMMIEIANFVPEDTHA